MTITAFFVRFIKALSCSCEGGFLFPQSMLVLFGPLQKVEFLLATLNAILYAKDFGNQPSTYETVFRVIATVIKIHGVVIIKAQSCSHRLRVKFQNTYCKQLCVGHGFCQ